MKEWFENLQARERRYLIGGIAALACILLYFLLWSPLSSNVNKLHESTAIKRDDLSWMQSASKQIIQLRGANPNRRGGSRSLLSVVDQNFASAGLKGALQRMEPDGRNSVKLWFNQGSFDGLISMLGKLDQEEGIVIKSLSITPADGPGLVDARITLLRGGS